jgi:hypothetical protein
MYTPFVLSIQLNLGDKIVIKIRLGATFQQPENPESENPRIRDSENPRFRDSEVLLTA